jgi:hypothetical protein
MRPTTLHINEVWSTRKVDIHMRPTTLHINEFWSIRKVDIHMRPTTLHINEFWSTCKVDIHMRPTTLHINEFWSPRKWWIASYSDNWFVFTLTSNFYQPTERVDRDPNDYNHVKPKKGKPRTEHLDGYE